MVVAASSEEDKAEETKRDRSHGQLSLKQRAIAGTGRFLLRDMRLRRLEVDRQSVILIPRLP
jgi:hypothetical protein